MFRALLLLHLSIIIAGFTGVLGRFISVDAFALVLYRTVMAAAFLFLLLLWQRRRFALQLSDIPLFLIGGVLVLHWIGFYGSIKLSNVSIGVTCLSSMAFFSALLEPWLLKRAFAVREFIFAIIGMIGIALIFNFETHYRTGIVCGLACACGAALYTVLNKKYGTKQSSRERTVLLEMLGGGVTMLVLLPVYITICGGEGLAVGLRDALALLFLASVCTVGLYLLQINVLRQLSAFTVNLSYNLEPVYSIVLAMILFAENQELTLAFYAGLSLIILSVLLQTFTCIRAKG